MKHKYGKPLRTCMIKLIIIDLAILSWQPPNALWLCQSCQTTRKKYTEGIFIPGIIPEFAHNSKLCIKNVCNVLQTNFVLGSCLFYQMKIILLHVSNIMQCTVYVHIYAVIFISILVLFCNFPLFSGNEQHIFKIIFDKMINKLLSPIKIWESQFFTYYFTYWRSFDQIILNIIIKSIYTVSLHIIIDLLLSQQYL